MENKLKIGDQVQISPRSEFKDQGRRDGKKLVGKIKGLNPYSSWQYEVYWSDGNSYVYKDKDLVLFLSSEPNYEIY
jgi:hypothetical protein